MPVDRTLPYNARFTPLLRRATPKTPHFQAAWTSLVHWNNIDVPVTWCTLSNDWVPWTMPMRVLKRQKKLVRVAASGYHKIKNLQPPRCPHLYQDARLSDMKLHLNKAFDNSGQRANFFKADSHPCQFYASSNYSFRTSLNINPSTSQPPRSEKSLLVSFSDNEEEEQSRSSFVQETSLSSPSGFSKDAHEVEEYLLHGNPRIHRPTDLPPALLGPLKPFFNERVSNARKTVDLLLMDDTQQFADRGYYTGTSLGKLQTFHSFFPPDRPQLHPVAEKPNHILMEIYDHKIVDGYNSHVVDGKCSMAPPLEKVPLKEITPPRFEVRTYPHGYKIPVLEDFVDTPSGVAFTEWNSRIGVPMDVWILLSTSGVECKTCHLRRSYDAHLAHCDTTGQCLDPGGIPSTLAV
ncbi:hypothetical protein B0H11DRAFT_1905962 [Mycena galericulata]|nr:hypothetical protein B0H11DRAFT_1905962 [Mycena galericulata]